MLNALTERSDEDKVGPSSWSARSSPIPTLYTGGTAKSTISPVGVNLLPTFPDHHSTSVKRPCLQQQFIPRCPVDAATPGNPETSLSPTESHEKVTTRACAQPIHPNIANFMLTLKWPFLLSEIRKILVAPFPPSCMPKCALFSQPPRILNHLFPLPKYSLTTVKPGGQGRAISKN